MRARRPAHTSTNKSLADHKLEICRRIICELIATLEIDDDTTAAGSEQVAPSLTPTKRGRPTFRTAKGGKHHHDPPDTSSLARRGERAR